MKRLLYLSVDKDVYEKIKIKKNALGFSTITKYILYLVSMYNGEELLTDYSFNSKNRKIIKFTLTEMEYELLKKHAETFQDIPNFLRALVKKDI